MTADLNKKEKLKNPDSETSGLAFSAAIIAVIAASLIFSGVVGALSLDKESDLYFYLSFALPPLLPAASVLAVVRYKKVDIGYIGGLFNFKFKKRYYFVIVLLTVGMFFALGGLNTLFIKFLSLFGYEETAVTLPDKSALSVVLCTLLIAVIPPVTEEVVFRGVVNGGMQKWGYKSIFIVAALFALYHLSPAKTAYQFVVGALFSLVFIKTKSVVPTIAVHFLNNLIIILNEYYGVLSFYESNVALFSIIGALSLFGALALIFTDGEKIAPAQKEERNVQGFILGGLVGLVLAVAVWIAGLMV